MSRIAIRPDYMAHVKAECAKAKKRSNRAMWLGAICVGLSPAAMPFSFILGIVGAMSMYYAGIWDERGCRDWIFDDAARVSEVVE